MVRLSRYLSDPCARLARMTFEKLKTETLKAEMGAVRSLSCDTTRRKDEKRGSGSRLPLERAMQIDDLLQSKQFPNCSALARELEVANRTIKRDIYFMKVRMNRPIAYDSERGG